MRRATSKLRPIVAALALACAGVPLAATPAAAADEQRDRYAIRVVADRGVAARAARAVGAAAEPVVGSWYRVGSLTAAEARDLADEPGVAEVRLVGRARATRVPNDPGYGQQEHLPIVRAPQAWDVTTGSPSAVVAVIDTPVDTSHTDLATVVTQLPGHYTSTTECSSAHGTHVAGLVAARGNDASGVTGLLWQGAVLSIPALDQCGEGYGDDIAAAIRDAVDARVRVLNLSLSIVDRTGAPYDDVIVREAVARAVGAGVVVVAAAGNDGFARAGFPAVLPGVVGVGATDWSDAPATYSNQSPEVALTAPGGTSSMGVTSTVPAVGGDRTRYGRIAGTSMSSPQVAGAAALLLSQDPGMTRSQVVTALVRSSAATTGACRSAAGGRLDVRAALDRGVRAFGFRMATTGGQVRSCFEATLGQIRLGQPLNRPVVGIAAKADGTGYWLVAADGGIFPFGDAGGYGSTGGMRLNQPVVGMAAPQDGSGYWLVAADGGIFPFGSAGGYGSTGGMRLNQPIVGMAPTATGRGYWLVASDGGIFPFGDAGGYGSTGGIRLNQPIVGMAPTASGRGYWLVASDGGIFPFGDARGIGSLGSLRLNQPIIGMKATPTGDGYWLVARDGGLFPFGDATPRGSMVGTTYGQAVVGVA